MAWFESFRLSAVSYQPGWVHGSGSYGWLTTLSAFGYQPSAMQDFRKLEVWQLAHQLALDIYRNTQSFPSREQSSLTDQMRRAAVSIEANLAEGCGRGGDADFARFVQIAFGSACELECHLLLARDLGFLPAAAHVACETKLMSVKRMLSGLLKKLRNGGL